mmetsp:Transcript_16385/g.25954  ORF Transcript_16385/g.25954 Transcript_16385/m.25954 type:complete len:84 (-) Transcript_16385:324-575(-)
MREKECLAFPKLFFSFTSLSHRNGFGRNGCIAFNNERNRFVSLSKMREKKRLRKKNKRNEGKKKLRSYIVDVSLKKKIRTLQN